MSADTSYVKFKYIDSYTFNVYYQDLDKSAVLQITLKFGNTNWSKHNSTNFM